MIRKLLFAATFVAIGLPAISAHAQAPDRARVDRELREFNDACQHGNRGACIRFGIILGEHPEARQDWRHAHPEYFWWEREPH